MCFDWNLFWSAMSSIGTIIAVIAALFITKWQDVINNRKKLKIEYHNGQILGDAVREFDGFPSGKSINCIFIKFINTGNRRIIISGVKFELSNKKCLSFTNIYDSSDREGMTLPRVLEVEESDYYKFSLPFFLGLIRDYVEPLKKLDCEIIIVVDDTAGKEYRHKTGISYRKYLELVN